MANKIQIKRGTNLSNAGTPAAGELIFDSGNNKLYVGNGTTAATGLTAISGAVSAVANGSNNRIATFSSSTALNGEGNLIFDGTDLTVAHSSGSLVFAAAHAADKIKFYGSGGSEKIGTEANTLLFTADNYKFKDTNNDVNLFMNNSGNIGIGTVSPSNPLHINNSYPQLRLQTTDDNTYTTFGSGTGYMVFNIVNPSTNTYEFRSGNSAQMTISTDGKVGIGNTSPAAWLDVSKDNSNSGNQFVVADTEGANAGVRTYSAAHPAGLILNHYYAVGGSPYMRYADLVANVGSGAATTMRFITKNSSNAYSTTTINDSGNLGVGRTSPTYKLDVNGDLRLTNSGDQQIRFERSGANAFSIEIDSSRMYWYNRTTSTALVGIDNAGNFGVGTVSPTSKVHIYNGNGSIPDDANNHLLIEDDGHAYIGIGGGTSSDVGLHFMDSGGIRGRVAYHHAADTMTFNTSNALAMTIQAAGNLMLNTKAITGVSGFYGASGTFIGYNNLYQFKNTSSGILSAINSTGLGIGATTPSTKIHISAAPDSRTITFDQSGRINGIGSRFEGNATGSYVNIYCSDGGTNGDTNSRMKIYADGRLTLTNSANVDMLLAKATRMGYSASYKALVIGETSGTFTTAIAYDPSTNASSAFTGDGREVIFRNGVEFTTPNSANNGFHNDVLVLKDGKVGISTASPSYTLSVTGTIGSTGAITANSGKPVLTESGSWIGDLGSNGYTKAFTYDVSSCAYAWVTKGGQMSTLLDGSYFAYEANTTGGGGFWSSYTSGYGNACGIKASGNSELIVKQVDGGTCDLKLTADLVLPYGAIIDGGTDVNIQATNALVLKTGGANARYNIANNGNHSIYGNTYFSSPMEVQYGAVFNEGSHDSDFRIESNGKTHAFVVDAGADRVDIGTSFKASYGLHIDGLNRAGSNAASHHLRTKQNILTFSDSTNWAGAMVINTDITRASARMCSIHVEGYAYGSGEIIDFTMSFYTYSGANGQDGLAGYPYNCAIVDRGTDGHQKFIGINAAGNVAIAIDDYNGGNKYYYGFKVTLDNHLNGVTHSAYNSWTVTKSTTSGLGWLDKRVPPGNIRMNNRNLGIGLITNNVAPDSRLVVSENGGTTDDFFKVNPTNGGNRTMTIDGEKIDVTLTNGGGSHYLVLQDNGGSVGINTTSPGAKLTVYKDGTQASSISSTYQIMTVSNSNGGIAIQAGASSDAILAFGDEGQYDAGRIRYDNAAHTMEFCTGGNNPRMTINSSGVVGIGGTGNRIHLRSSDGVIHWGNSADFGTLTWDTGKAILTSQAGKTLELRNKNNSDMVAIEDNQIRFIADGTERFRANGNGLDLSNNSATKICHNTNSTRDKYRVWNSSYYCIGMDATYTFGSLGGYAMTFQMNDEDGRGFWWGDHNMSNAQGAMTLDTDGKLSVAHSVRLGYGISDTTESGATYALDVSGSIGATADVVAYVSSDKRLKDNIKNIANPLEKLNKLNGIEFDWNDKQDLYKGHDIGVIAQEVEEVLPEIVETREDGHKAVKYDRMVALLIEAIKEQQEQIDELRKGNFVIQTGD